MNQELPNEFGHVMIRIFQPPARLNFQPSPHVIIPKIMHVSSNV